MVRHNVGAFVQVNACVAFFVLVEVADARQAATHLSGTIQVTPSDQVAMTSSPASSIGIEDSFSEGRSGCQRIARQRSLSQSKHQTSEAVPGEVAAQGRRIGTCRFGIIDFWLASSFMRFQGKSRAHAGIGRLVSPERIVEQKFRRRAVMVSAQSSYWLSRKPQDSPYVFTVVSMHSLIVERLKAIDSCKSWQADATCSYVLMASLFVWLSDTFADSSYFSQLLPCCSHIGWSTAWRSSAEPAHLLRGAI